jgi:hypothetical protein
MVHVERLVGLAFLDLVRLGAKVNEGTHAIRLTDEQRIDWLRLIRSQNVGPHTFRTLINHFGGAGAAIDALPALARRGGSGGSGASPQIYSREQAKREIEAAHKLGASLVAIGEADYPRRLQMIDDAPPLVGIRGHIGVLTMPHVAIVGSRNASAAGVKITQGSRKVFARRALPLFPDWRAASMPPRTAQVSPPERSPFSPAARTASIRLNMPNCWKPFCPRVSR